jgi:hypothetical protein
MERLGYDSGKWIAGTAAVDGSLDSDTPVWVLTARRGRQRIHLASGPHPTTRHTAEEIAAHMNSLAPDQWNHFIEHVLPALLENANGWG